MSPAQLPPAARERLAARARRVALIRRRVVVATLAAFVVAWGVIAYAGPMGAKTQAAPTPTAATQDQSTSSSDGGLAPVTTAQS
jgi:hypothetical protein